MKTTELKPAHKLWYMLFRLLGSYTGQLKIHAVGLLRI